MTDQPPYDPDARRDTPLALKLKARIKREGPIPIQDFMTACLQDRDHGYYRTRPAIGRDGDFITAPEISQTFGELIGLWCAAVWQGMGEPRDLQLIELGPGRGTLMKDVIRAIRIVPGFATAVKICLIESNAVLQVQQRQTLRDSGHVIEWVAAPHLKGKDLNTTRAPVILIGNEFLDTIPVRQIREFEGKWYHRRVGLDANGGLAFVKGPLCADEPPGDLPSRAKDGSIYETAASYQSAIELGGLMSGEQIMAGLYLDYGHTRSGLGSTLQAIRAHTFEHPLTSPGEADLSAQVDFNDVSTAARKLGLAVDGPVTQAEFLGSLGIMERASRLIAANPHRANEIETGVARLMTPNGMGTRFKALGLRSPQLPLLPGFPVTPGTST